MKASLTFREEQKPLFRAKVPLNILGFPFQSAIVAGESKELSLNLSTFFDSGPSFKFAYRPNDSLNAFSLIFKTGIGHFGSPISSPINMSAEFNLIGHQNPSFFVHFKPQFGDFTVRKSQSSDFVKSIKSNQKGAVSDEDASVEVIEAPAASGTFSGEKTMVLPSESPVARVIDGLLKGVEVSVRTVLPLIRRAVVKFRWGVRLQAADEAAVARADQTTGISFHKFPLLVMNKIKIEHVAEDVSKSKNKVGPSMVSPENADVAEACLEVKKQMVIIQAENGMLRKSMDDLRRSESVARKLLPPTGGVDLSNYRAEAERGKVDRRSNGDKKSSESANGFGGKATEEDDKEELKKGLMMGATSA